MVQPEPEEAGDGLGAEHPGGLETRVARAHRMALDDGMSPSAPDELRVELAHRHQPVGVGRRRVRLAEREDRLVELSARQRLVGLNPTSGPMSPAATTCSIWACAQLGPPGCERRLSACRRDRESAAKTTRTPRGLIRPRIGNLTKP